MYVSCAFNDCSLYVIESLVSAKCFTEVITCANVVCDSKALMFHFVSFYGKIGLF